MTTSRDPRDQTHTRADAPRDIPLSRDEAAADAAESAQPGDEVPVPPAMSAAEIDERAQVVEALRQQEREASSTDA